MLQCDCVLSHKGNRIHLKQLELLRNNFQTKPLSHTENKHLSLLFFFQIKSYRLSQLPLVILIFKKTTSLRLGIYLCLYLGNTSAISHLIANGVNISAHDNHGNK